MMKNHQIENASFLYLHGDFVQVLIDPDLGHARGSNSLPSTRIPITLIPDSEISASTLKSHVK